MDYLYNIYVKNGNISIALKTAANTIKKEMKDSVVSLSNDLQNINLLNFEEIKDKIIFQLVNTEQNKEFLKTIPHRDFLDLSIIYKILIDDDKDKEIIRKCTINNGIMKCYNITEEEIYNLAMKNTKKLLPPTCIPLRDVLMKMMGAGNYFNEFPYDFLTPGMYIISNKTQIDGAGSILYDDILEEMAEKFDSDFYILPSSVHEFIAVPVVDGDNDVTQLSELVPTVNQSELELEERLSNNIYRYNRDTKEITLESNSKERLDFNKNDDDLDFDR